MDEKIALLKSLGFTDEFLAFLTEEEKKSSFDLMANNIGPLINESLDSSNDIIFEGFQPNAITDKIGNNLIY